VLQSLEPDQAAQTILFLPLGGKTFGDAPFQIGAATTSGLLVTFTSTTPAVCSARTDNFAISGKDMTLGTVTILSGGVCIVAADQAGNASFKPAVQVLQSFTVAKANQTIAFTAPASKSTSDPPFSVSATSTSGLGVTFSSLTTGVCTVSGNTVTLVSAGTCTIAANQAGNASYNAAAQVTRNISVGTSCSALSPASGQLPAGFVGTPYNQTFALDGGVSPITFSVNGALPGGLSFTNGALSGTPTVRGAFSMTVTGADANSCQISKTYAIAISAERRLVVGAGAGGGGSTRAFTLGSASPVLTTNSGSTFNGGASVAEADVDGNGVADVITGAGPGGGPSVTVFDGTSAAARLTFMAFAPAFSGGVEVAAGDITGDGQPEILAVQGCASTSTPIVRAFDGRTGAMVREYAVSASVAGCGLHVAAGDVNGDGVADVVVGSAGFGPAFVQVIDGSTGTAIRESFPYSNAYMGGVFVAAGDVNGDGFADIVTGAGPGGTPHVRVFDGTTGNQIPGTLGSFLAYPAAFAGGVRVAAGDVNGDGRAEVITGAGPGGGPHVRVFDGATTSELLSFFAFDPTFTGGVFVAAPVSSARMSIDIAARTTGTQMRIAGWALREIAANTNGNDAIHVWAVPVTTGVPIFVGAAPERTPRSDVASVFGGEFLMSGFDFTGTLAAGTYDLVVYARNTRTQKFDQTRVVRIVVP